jgi:hypothetical protein
MRMMIWAQKLLSSFNPGLVETEEIATGAVELLPWRRN